VAREENNEQPFTLLLSGQEKGTLELGVAFLVDWSIKGNALNFKTVDERICT